MNAYVAKDRGIFGNRVVVPKVRGTGCHVVKS